MIGFVDALEMALGFGSHTFVSAASCAVAP